MSPAAYVLLAVAALIYLGLVLCGCALALLRAQARHHQALSAQIGRWMDDSRQAHARVVAAAAAQCPHCPKADIGDLRAAATALGEIAGHLRDGRATLARGDGAA